MRQLFQQILTHLLLTYISHLLCSYLRTSIKNMPILITYPLLTSITVIKVSMFEAYYQYLAMPLSDSFPQLSLPEVVVSDLTRVLLPAIPFDIDINITLSSRSH